MQKTPELFDARNEQKKRVEFIESYPTDARVGEFWRYREGINIGNEISKDGRFMRVCFVLQNDLGNGLLLAAPITTKHHVRMDKYTINIRNPEKYGLKECWLVLNQIKLIDKRRLINNTGVYKPLLGFATKTLYSYRDLIKKNHPKPHGKE